MRPGGGKQKGAQFERDICVKLSLWVSHGKRKDLFWRSAMSGGRATVQRRKGERNLTQVGDVSAVHPEGALLTDRFYIECKHVRDLDFAVGLLFDRGKLYGFWTKAVSEAKACGRQPMLIAKQNGWDVLVLLSDSGFSRFEPISHLAIGTRKGVGYRRFYVVRFAELLRQEFVIYEDQRG